MRLVMHPANPEEFVMSYSQTNGPRGTATFRRQ